MRPSRALLLAAVTVAAALICLLPVPDALGWLRAACAVLLVLVLPGLAVTAALFPWHTLSVAVRLLFTVGLSVCITALLGYVLNWNGPGLQRIWWIGALGYLTQLAAVIAVIRRRDAERFRSQMTSLAPLRDLPPAWSATRAPVFRIRRGACLLFALAALITTTAFAINYVNANDETGPGFTQLWMLPTATNAVRLGVTNHEGRTVRYRLVLSVPGTSLASWPALALQPGHTWTGTVSLPSWLPFGTELTGTLYRGSGPHAVPYRHVTYWTH